MGKVNNLLGNIFGKLTVIERSENTKWKKSTWLCECKCGNTKVIIGSDLISGRTTSCGCIRKEVSTFNINMINKKYNTYDIGGDYGIGYTNKGEEFYFDLEDYDKIKDYCCFSNKLGYIICKINNKYVQFHRFITTVVDLEVDHINHDVNDNRKFNLRICSHQENMFNRVIQKNNSSGKTGVVWSKNNNKWIAQIGFNGKVINLGYFSDIQDAIVTRKKAEESYFGEFRYKQL